MSESLAIVEKKPHRPGGCAGIFFQLFDWNRRFAKEKLFSKKLLPSANPKQCERKFGRDEKLPKLRLIVNENSGGFPNMKKNGSSNSDSKQKPQMRSPSLVARLMGLESIPAVQKNKSLEEISVFQTNTQGDKCTSTQNVISSSLEKENGNGKYEARPQKAQKTGPSERQALNNFTAEMFHFKSVLSRTKKHHKPKLVSPVKNHRVSSGRPSSRLIGVASKILELDLQNTNRAKSAIAYSSSTHNSIGNSMDFVMERELVSPDMTKSSDFHFSTDSSTISACKHCGSQVEKLETTPNLEEKAIPIPSSLPNNSIHNIEEIERRSVRPPLTSLEQEKWRVNERCQELSIPFTAQVRNDRKHYSGERRSQAQWNSTSQQSKPRRDSQSPVIPKHKTHRQSQVSTVRDRVPHRPHRTSSVANAVDRSETCTPIKVDYVACNEESSSFNRRGGSLLPIRKRRSTSTNHSSESSNFPSSTIIRQRNARCNIVGEKEKEIRLDSHSFNSANRGSSMGRGNNYKTNGSKGINVTSSLIEKNESGIICSRTQELSTSGGNDTMVNAEKLLAVSGNGLGAILQQKLKELSYQEEDDLLTGNDPKRTTVVILQELISALSSEKPMLRDDVVVESEEKTPCHSPQLPNRRSTSDFQVNQKTASSSHGYLPEDEHLSPGSVLEASFSNGSCLSSRFGGGSEVYYDGLPKLEPAGSGILDYAASLNKGCSNIHSLVYLIGHVSEVLLSLGFANGGVKQSKLAYAEEVILNTELISRNESQGLSVCHFLVYELENLANTMWADFGRILGLENQKHKNQIKEFVFHCLIEFLDARYGQYSSCRFLPWTRMPLCSIANDLVDEVRGWMDFGEYGLDEIIDYEMSHSFGKWTDFEIEEYETGADISKVVLQILVNDVVVELSECKLRPKRM